VNELLANETDEQFLARMNFLAMLNLGYPLRCGTPHISQQSLQRLIALAERKNTTNGQTS
jgi:hypothetical protein